VSDEPPPRRTMRLAYRAVLLAARFSRPMLLGVRAVVIDDAERIFLVRHSYVAGWHLPGGGVEVGETLLTALRRELVEEGNIVLDAEPALHGVFFNRKLANRDHVALYVVRAFHQTGPRRPDREIVEAGFFPRAHLPAATSPATHARLAEIFAGAPISELW
jgi:ADP-ribose pyrophosphatase YjhB (NUDIX family)